MSTAGITSNVSNMPESGAGASESVSVLGVVCSESGPELRTTPYRTTRKPRGSSERAGAFGLFVAFAVALTPQASFPRSLIRAVRHCPPMTSDSPMSRLERTMVGREKSTHRRLRQGDHGRHDRTGTGLAAHSPRRLRPRHRPGAAVRHRRGVAVAAYVVMGMVQFVVLLARAYDRGATEVAQTAEELEEAADTVAKTADELGRDRRDGGEGGRTGRRGRRPGRPERGDSRRGRRPGRRRRGRPRQGRGSERAGEGGHRAGRRGDRTGRPGRRAGQRGQNRRPTRPRRPPTRSRETVEKEKEHLPHAEEADEDGEADDENGASGR